MPRLSHKARTRAKVVKLREMTVERGCTPDEAATARQMVDELEAGLASDAGTPGELHDYACPECGATVLWSESADDDLSYWYCPCGAHETWDVFGRQRWWDRATNDGFRFPIYRDGREAGYIEVLVRPETRGRRCARCRGTGRFAYFQGELEHATSVTSHACSTCGGTGRIGDEPARSRRHRVVAGVLPPPRRGKKVRS